MLRQHPIQEPDSTLLLAGGMGRHWPDARGIFHNEKKDFLVWCNEEDHTRIIAMEMGDDIRPVTSLSGGESFLASLALALGLSSLAARDVRIDSLFIDEGFGTLDHRTLQLVLDTLDTLQSTGRKVGIISHVSGIAERVGYRVDVRARGQGRSAVITNQPGQ